MLLRVLATLGFAYIAFQTYSSDEELLGIKYFLVFGAAAVLYNPILPIYLPREVWTIINLATTILVFHHWQAGKQGNFETEKNNQPLAKPSNSFERSYSINYDKDVTRPLQLQKSNFRESFYSERYDRIVSLWTLGYVHGFMAYATFLDVELEHEEALERVQPFTDTILKNVFSEKEFADFKSLNHDQLHQSAEWEDGFEWGLRNCESWQEHGEVTLIWSDYISGERDSIFTFNKPSEAVWPAYEEEEAELEELKANSQEQNLFNPPNPDLQTILFMGSPEQICEQYLSMETKSRSFYETAVANRSVEDFGKATMRLAAYSSVAIYGFCFFLARTETNRIEITAQQVNEIIYTDFLFEFFDFAWLVLNYTCHAHKFSGFDEEKLNELLKSTEVETTFPYIALQFLVGDENVDHAYEKLQDEISKKQSRGHNLDQFPSIETKTICQELEKLNLIGDPTELQVFNARFLHSTFDSPPLVDRVAFEVNKSKLCKNLQTRIINSLSEKQTGVKYSSFEEWLFDFKAECDKVRGGVSGFIDFMNTDGLKQAYFDGKKPSEIAYHFAKDFDPFKLK